MKKAIIYLTLMVVFTQCQSLDDFEKGKKQLESQGYTEVKNTGLDMFCCDQKDEFTTGFVCKDKSGNIVRGCICSGIYKGITIRYK